ncbi:2-dehydro-3-deoxygalactonokinase [Cereibacter sphaeroides]|uniref:2-dehydro-3-deoxygalactonokinase n=1 Tax=Cereibacter sphaeroides TaxID=1063 RepID=UPI001F35D601|nr:2-dehydro-3-deoxygalactonokinase [Cereibacter sphaeroides]MCE6960888.1 2-dehydro-3-deoxygalactonokinase [Cereibacter sphaeroides]MCE6969814.1 2-dehydro-3-deoxygalactonokinase [Cereibacter sphaeroides]MCE6975289.1 2-dehydro-3-deoxygalactonokinase [Cereibacter sphaeroides]
MKPDWIAVDWGTTQLRAWAMGPEGPLAEAASAEGTAQLAPDEFEPALLRLLDPWLHGRASVPVVACGMINTEGGAEARLRSLPCAPVDPAALVAVPIADPRLSLRVVPGLGQSDPADVMHGEETRIAGALAALGRFDGVICLPGPHSKWAQVSAGEVVSFRTFMTGELFALLSQQSVLRHGLAGEGWDEAAFLASVSDGIAHPQKLSAKLFGLRSEAILRDLPAATARARLSGLLIGLELAGARPYWLGQPVVLVGDGPPCASYAAALDAQGHAPRRLSGAACALAGLAAARGQVRIAASAGTAR